MTSLVEVASLRSISEGHFDSGAYWTMSLYGYLTLLFFGFLGMAASLLVKRGRSILGPGIGIVLGSYLLTVFGELSDKAAQAATISPYSYLNTSVVSPGYGVEIGNVAYFVCAALACLATAVIIYRRKDIYL